MWPAALGLFAFVWMELVYPHNVDLSPVRLWCGVYLGLMIIGGALFGNTFYARADPFEVYSSLVAQVSIWGRRDGQLVLRSPLANLDTTPATPGLIGVVAVLFGSTAFDAFRDSTAVADVHPGHRDVDVPAEQPRPARLLPRRRR